jgi:hypothetical protein
MGRSTEVHHVLGMASLQEEIEAGTGQERKKC